MAEARVKIVTVKELPKSNRGRIKIDWEGRLIALQDKHLGKWVDATETWGTSPGAAKAVRATIAEMGIAGDAHARKPADTDIGAKAHVFIRVQ